MSFTEEAGTYRELGGKAYARTSPSAGSLLLLAYAGKGPVKQEIRPSVSIPDDKGVLHTFEVALPKFVPDFRRDGSTR